MDASQPRKSRAGIDLNHDYISSLPENVKEKILVKLQTKEVVRTSILSSKWVDRWISIPELVFEEECTKSQLIKLIDMVLINHQGPIRKFKLVSKFKVVSNHAFNEATDRWLFILSKNGIKDLELVDDANKRCKISFRLFSCTLLERLCLSGCIINVSPSFQVFQLVHILCLSYFDLKGISIENMVSGFPLLDHLELSHFVHQGCLRILAPKLIFLNIVGEFYDIVLETPKLASGCIHLVSRADDYQHFSAARDKETNIIRALGRLSNIQKLDILGEFCDYLAIGPIPENLPVVFDHLTNIRLHLFNNPEEIGAALCMFENTPNLEILHMEFAAPQGFVQPNVESAWEPRTIKDCLFKHLKVVSITYGEDYGSDSFLPSYKAMLRFAKFVLSSASVLEKLNFIELEDVMVIFEMLKWFPKLSKKAEILFVPSMAAQ